MTIKLDHINLTAENLKDEPILKVFNFPTTTDRNKAGYILVSLSLKEKNKKLILLEAGMFLLEMPKLEHPNNHDPAFSILKNISGENFGERDYESWKKQLNSSLITILVGLKLEFSPREKNRPK